MDLFLILDKPLFLKLEKGFFLILENFSRKHSIRDFLRRFSLPFDYKNPNILSFSLLFYIFLLIEIFSLLKLFKTPLLNLLFLIDVMRLISSK